MTADRPLMRSRSLRVPDPIWDALGTAAKALGSDRSTVLRGLIITWLGADTRCSTCDGRGWIEDLGYRGVRECSDCTGTGYRKGRRT